jgi:integrase
MATSKRGNREGHIRKRADGRWEAQLTVHGRKRRYLYGKTRDEVAQKLTAATHALNQGIAPTPGRQTVAQFLATWLEGKRATLRSPRTYDRYEEYVRLHLVPTLGKTALVKLSPQQVQHLYAEKLASGLSAMTVHHIHRVLHTALESALRQGIVRRNVSKLVDAPRMGRAEMHTWTPEQAQAFLATAQRDRQYALYMLALATGMRQAELFGLRWRDVDLDGGTLRIVTTVRHGASVEGGRHPDGGDQDFNGPAAR